MQENSIREKKSSSTKQYSTFYIGERLYGIDVMQVQEVTRTLPITRIPLSPNYVKGLINLRGQIATAIGLRNLFELSDAANETQMNVVCRMDGVLLSFLVDKIGDVVEVDESSFEPPPDTIPESVKRFMHGVYKTAGPILSIIEVDKITTALNKKNGN